jgi:hypothetical protein
MKTEEKLKEIIILRNSYFKSKEVLDQLPLSFSDDSYEYLTDLRINLHANYDINIRLLPEDLKLSIAGELEIFIEKIRSLLIKKTECIDERISILLPDDIIPPPTIINEVHENVTQQAIEPIEDFKICMDCGQKYTCKPVGLNFCDKQCYMKNYWRIRRKDKNGKVVLKEKSQLTIKKNDESAADNKTDLKELIEKCKKTPMLECTKVKRPEIYHE